MIKTVLILITTAFVSYSLWNVVCSVFSENTDYIMMTLITFSFPILFILLLLFLYVGNSLYEEDEEMSYRESVNQKYSSVEFLVKRLENNNVGKLENLSDMVKKLRVRNN